MGIKHELTIETVKLKSPEFLVSNNFEFNKLSKIPNFAIAQSLFTHLPPKNINLCFENLRKHFDPEGAFFATYFVSDVKVQNLEQPHDHKVFRYTIEEIQNFGQKNGWDCEFIGNWGHPRNQQIAKYSLA